MNFFSIASGPPVVAQLKKNLNNNTNSYTLRRHTKPFQHPQFSQRRILNSHSPFRIPTREKKNISANSEDETEEGV